MPAKILDFFHKLTKELKANNINYEQHEHHVSANGYNIYFKEGEYVMYSSGTGLKCDHEVIISPKEVVWYISSSVKGLKEEVNFVLDKKGNFLFRKRRFLEKHKKFGNHAKIINHVLNKAHKGIITPTFALLRIKKALKGFPSKKITITTDSFLTKYAIIPVIDNISLPIPLDPLYIMPGNIIVIDFVIMESLVSFPGMIKHFIKMAEGKNEIIYPYQIEYSMMQYVRPVHIVKEWQDIILKSPFKMKVYKTILYLLSRGNNFEYLITRNGHIWNQIALLYGIGTVDFTLLPAQFIENIRGYSLVKQ